MKPAALLTLAAVVAMAPCAAWSVSTSAQQPDPVQEPANTAAPDSDSAAR